MTSAGAGAGWKRCRPRARIAGRLGAERTIALLRKHSTRGALETTRALAHRILGSMAEHRDRVSAGLGQTGIGS